MIKEYTPKEISEKFNIPIEKARLVITSPYQILVDTKYFTNIHDPEIQEIIKTNTEYCARSWAQKGPCSNWGVDILRPMTQKEYDSVIQNSVNKIKKLDLNLVAELKATLNPEDVSIVVNYENLKI